MGLQSPVHIDPSQTGTSRYVIMHVSNSGPCSGFARNWDGQNFIRNYGSFTYHDRQLESSAQKTSG